MRIIIITPAAAGSRHGNRTTARRWQIVLGGLGHQVTVLQEWQQQPCDLLIALHARRSLTSMRRFRARHPRLPLVLALTGTDLYRDLAAHDGARTALTLATRLVVLQERALQALPVAYRRRTEVIHQSVLELRLPAATRVRTFDICVLAHLRSVKDPLRAARAARLLPATSRIRIMHAGAALAAALAGAARQEARRNPRYQWLGSLPRWRVRRLLAGSRLLVLASRSEGGANAISEALAADVPVLASRIDGNVGLLGEGYPGLFAWGCTGELAALMQRAEEEPRFLARLRAACRKRRSLASPRREQQAWRRLLTGLARSARRG